MNHNEEIIKLLKSTERLGMSPLCEFLESSDFFTAPASTAHHLAEPGGLAQHSLNVYRELRSINERYGLELPATSMIICGLLHDICKVNFYAIEPKNVKENGKWVEKQVYVVKDSFPMGHGEKSVAVIQKYINLNNDEMLAIRWHMGAWDADGYPQRRCLNDAMNRSQLLNALMTADSCASKFLEGR